MISNSFKYVLSISLLLGYYKELNYQRRDGSFSAYGNIDISGSMWYVRGRFLTLCQVLKRSSQR